MNWLSEITPLGMVISASPATGATTTFAEVPAPPMGLAFDAGGVLWMTGGTLYEAPGFIWRVDRTGAVVRQQQSEVENN